MKIQTKIIILNALFLAGIIAAGSFDAIIDAVSRLVFFLDNTIELQLHGIERVLLTEVHTQSRLFRLVAMIIIASIILGIVLFSLFFLLRIKRKFSEMQNTMGIMATGNLTVLLNEKGNDELSRLSRSINFFIHDFSSIISQITGLSQESVALREIVEATTARSSTVVEEMTSTMNGTLEDMAGLVAKLQHAATATERILQQIHRLSQQIENQASAVTQSTASVTQMNASVENVARVTGEREQASQHLLTVTKDGGEKLQGTNTLIEESTHDVEEVLEIVGIINAIASRTNLLSMNAAIEAAHAGESGAGFAVVAEEIRNLADSTNNHAQRIRNTVNNVAVRIGRVREAGHETRETFEAIEREARNTIDTFQEISSSMNELSIGSGEILEAMSSLSEISITIRDEAEEMKEQSSDMQQSVNGSTTLSEKININILEVESGVKRLKASLEQVDETNRKSSAAVAQLAEQVRVFKTDAESDIEPEELEQLEEI